MQTVLLISNIAVDNNQTAILRSFVTALNDRDSAVHYAFAAVQDLVFELTDRGESHIWLHGHELAEQCTTLHLRNMQKYPDYANALRLYTEARGLQLVNRADATYPYLGKVSQGFLFGQQGIATPALLSSPSNATLSAWLDERRVAYPLIIKHNDGVMGLHNHLVHGAAEKDVVLQQAKQHYLAQPFIANDGEYRVLTFGTDEPPLIFRKRAGAGSHLNNTSRGGQAELVEAAAVDAVVLNDALRAAAVTGRDIGGVDVLLASSGEHYVLEVNSTPQLAMGAFGDLKQDRYAHFHERQEGARQ